MVHKENPEFFKAQSQINNMAQSCYDNILTMISTSDLWEYNLGLEDNNQPENHMG